LENSVKVNRLIRVSPEIGKSERYFTDTSTFTCKQIGKYSQQRTYFELTF